MLRRKLSNLGPYRKQLAVAGSALVAMLALATAHASGLIGATPTDSTASPAPSAGATATPGGTTRGGGGAKNIVQVMNHTDGRLAARGNVQIAPAPAPDVQPVNAALAYGSCNQCDT